MEDCDASILLDEKIAYNIKASAKSIVNFRNTTLYKFVTESGNDETNIIDQYTKKTYKLAENELCQLYKLLEECRKEKVIMHFSERQGSKANDVCGIMIDFDFKLSKVDTFTKIVNSKIVAIISEYLIKDIDWFTARSTIEPARVTSETMEANFHIVTITRCEYSEIKEGFKYGIHILIPNIKVPKYYRKYLCIELSKDLRLQKIFKDMSVINYDSCIDMNSASVPVLFVGSCKCGSRPYNLTYCFNVKCDIYETGFGMMNSTEISNEVMDNYCMVMECAINGQGALISKYFYDIKPEITVKAKDVALRYVKSADQHDTLDNRIQTLIMDHVEIKEIYDLLNILDSSYYSDRNKWRNVIYALSEDVRLYDLGIWFSQKCPEKFSIDSYNILWQEAISRRSTIKNPLSISSLKFWAKESSPDKFVTINERMHYTILTNYIFEQQGKLEHYNFAKLLSSMLSNKFIVDIDTNGKYTWYEFVTPGQKMSNGELWKWRPEYDPDELQIYISEKLVNLCSRVLQYLYTLRDAAENEVHVKYYKKIIANFLASQNNLFKDQFKQGIIKQSRAIFRRRGFAKSLDKMPNAIGICNGVLLLSDKCKLVDYYHEFPISKFAPSYWNGFDPTNPYTKLALDLFKAWDIEPDARTYRMFHLSESISNGPKSGIIMFDVSSGENGKTSRLRAVAKALGDSYASKVPIQLFTSKNFNSSQADPALAAIENYNFIYSEESEKEQLLMMSRLKEIVGTGEVSTRGNYQDQKTYTIKVVPYIASNYNLIIQTKDHGGWRRIKCYHNKTKFRNHPNPADPYERKADPRVNKELPEDPAFASAVFSILVHFYERLQREYGGNLANVSSPTIDYETENYRQSQDTMHRWISSSVVKSTHRACEYTTTKLAHMYLTWYSANIDNRCATKISEIINDIENSVLSSMIKISLTIPNTKVLQGCIVLDEENPQAIGGEEFICHSWYNPDQKIQTQEDRDNWWESQTVYCHEDNVDDDYDIVS